MLAAQMLPATGEGSYLRQQFPQVYGFLGGLAGTAPDEMQGSALDANTSAVRQGASYGYLPGLVAGSVPLGKAGAGLGMLAGMARGTGKAEEALAAVRGAQKFDNSALIGSKFVAPQDEALRLAQQRASLPITQGGLGLPVGNTPEQRAKAMGFNTDAYHATDADIIKFDNAKLGTNTRYMTGGDQEAVESAMLGHWFSDRDLTNKDPRGYMFGDVVYPVKLQKPKKINDKEFGSTSYIVKDPDNIRSRFAAFDPFRKTAAIAAAAGLAAPDLLAGQSPQQAPEFDNSALMK